MFKVKYFIKTKAKAQTSQHAGQTITELERKMLWPGDCCPDCNAAANLYFWAQDCVCGNCGVEFTLRSNSGKRRNNLGTIEPLRLKNKFRFTDDMIKAIVERNERQTDVKR